LDLKQKIKNAPQYPGCYIYKDSKEQVIYVGMSKFLPKRVASYFTKKHQDKKTKMISIRIPENILQTFKLQAQLQQRPYQSVIVELMRLWLKPEPGQVP
jgi:excinuclease UvrABC nuclease subunit